MSRRFPVSSHIDMNKRLLAAMRFTFRETRRVMRGGRLCAAWVRNGLIFANHPSTSPICLRNCEHFESIAAGRLQLPTLRSSLRLSPQSRLYAHRMCSQQ